MAFTDTGTLAGTQGIFCTPIGQPQRSIVTASVAPVNRLPGERGCMSPVEVLSEMRALNSYLQQLSGQLHVWTKTASSAPTCKVGTQMSTRECGLVMHDYSAKSAETNAELSRGRTSERDALYLLETVMENTRRLVIQFRNEVSGFLRRETASSGATSGEASCGRSYSEFSYDIVKRSVDGCAHPREAAKLDVSLRRVMQGSPSPLASTPSLAQAEVRDTNRTPAQASATQLWVSDGVAEHPRRRVWPAAQFCYMTHVEFKRGRLRRFLSPVTVKPGMYVIVPGDRGYDCGLVVQCALWNPHKQAYDLDTIQSLDCDVRPPGSGNSIMEIIRVATDKEVHRLQHEHVRMERLALATCREISDRLHLSMEILDCEYQYDGTKISFFFESAEMIDFRELNKELFRVFNARIWMQNTSRGVRNEARRTLEPSRRPDCLCVGVTSTLSVH